MVFGGFHESLLLYQGGRTIMDAQESKPKNASATPYAPKDTPPAALLKSKEEPKLEAPRPKKIRQIPIILSHAL
jgi:hypothetical protein